MSTKQVESSSLKMTIYPIGLAISVIFLAATLAAGSLLPATHHVLHWRCQTNHVACLLVGDLLLCVAQFGVTHFEYWPCFTIGKFCSNNFKLSQIQEMLRKYSVANF